jgi:hypothetical protein
MERTKGVAPLRSGWKPDMLLLNIMPARNYRLRVNIVPMITPRPLPNMNANRIVINLS